METDVVANVANDSCNDQSEKKGRYPLWDSRELTRAISMANAKEKKHSKRDSNGRALDHMRKTVS